MSSTAIIRALLVAHAPLTAQVSSDYIVAGVVPQGTPVPCIGMVEISHTEIPHIDANSPTQLVEARVEVAVMAMTYPDVKTLINLVRKAANYQRGSIAGLDVVSVRRVGHGPDLKDIATGIYSQTVDFMVTFYEVN